MRTGQSLASVRSIDRLDDVDRVVRSFEAAWRGGEPDLDQIWQANRAGDSMAVLAALVKVDLRCRFAEGQRPTANDYIERYPELRAQGERVLSLVYEEYCLREEQGERPDTHEFCERYAPWKDSLASQLRYHHVISRVVGKAPALPPFPAPGEQFEQFHILAELGRGGAARVYLARDGSLGDREVALKVSANCGSEPSLLGRLQHPNIVPVLSVASQAATGLRGLCMPYRPGLPLDQLIRRVRPGSQPASAMALWEALVAPPPPPSAGMAAADAPATPAAAPAPEGPGWKGFPRRGTYAQGVAWVALKLAEALEYAHEQKVWHRDVKPANILLTFLEGPQLLDFNLAHKEISADQAVAALRGGTLPYMAPEQLAAFLDPSRWGEVNQAADLYSLGLVIRELLTGESPETPDQKLPLDLAIGNLLNGRVNFRPEIRPVTATVPYALESIVTRCLSFSPHRRYNDAGALAEDLQRFLERRPLKHAPNVSVRERTANWTRRNRLVLAVSIVALAGWGLVVWGQRDRIFNRFEERAPFLQAVADFDSGRNEDALVKFNALVKEAPRSSIAEFYLDAVSVAQFGPTQDLLERLTRLWDRHGVESELVAWGRAHPSFAARAESLGTELLLSDNGYLRDRARREEVYNQADHIVEVALLLNPTLETAREDNAVIREYRRDFVVADSILAALITEKSRSFSRSGRDKLRALLLKRGRLATSWAREELARPQGNLEHGDTLLQKAVDHLNGSLSVARLQFFELVRSAVEICGIAECDALLRMAQTDAQGELFVAEGERYAIHYILAETNLARGEVAARQDDRARANRYFEEAKTELDRIAPLGAGKTFYQDLSRRVNAKLQSANAEIKAATPLK
jgi:serine/threonine protein kinase